VCATRCQYDATVNASLFIDVLDQISGLRLTAQGQPFAVLHTDSAGYFFTDPISFAAR